MITEQQRNILELIEQGEKDTLKLSEKTQQDQAKIHQALIVLGTQGFIEVELPDGTPKVRTITERGRNELADNSWLFE